MLYLDENRKPTCSANMISYSEGYKDGVYRMVIPAIWYIKVVNNIGYVPLFLCYNDSKRYYMTALFLPFFRRGK